MKMLSKKNITLMLMLIFLLNISLYGANKLNSSKIGVVNLAKVFREYYKSKIAQEAIKRQAQAYRNYLIRMNKEYVKLVTDAQNARKDSLNIALSEKAKKAAEVKADKLAQESAAKKAEIEVYARNRRTDMQKLENSRRKEIMIDIQSAVSKRAAIEGYDYVFDSSGMTMNNQPALLVFPKSADITEVIIKDLNYTGTKKK
jgi:outer membrane protein